MSPGLAFALLLLALAYGGVAVYAFRRPLLGKLALREAVRRPGQTLLVVGGLMVGTATITAGFVAADSVAESTIDTFAYRNYGHVDITVTANGRCLSPRCSPEPRRINGSARYHRWRVRRDRPPRFGG